MAISNPAILSTTSVALFATTLPAMAQVTPEEVWDAWTNATESAGYTIEVGSQSATGDQLILNDVTFAFEEGSTDLTGAIEEVRLVGASDGSVEVTYSPNYNLVLRETAIDGTAIEIPINADLSGLTTTVSGTTSALRHDLSAPSISVSVDGDQLAEDAGQFSVTASVFDLSGTLTLAEDSVDQDMSAGRLTFSANFSDPDGSAVVDATMNGITSSSSGPIASMMAFSGLADVLQTGQAAQSAFAYSDANYAIRGQGEDGAVAVDAMLGAGSVSANVSGAGVDYSVTSEGMDVTFQSSEMPGGAAGISAGLAAWTVSLPLNEEQGAQELGLKMELRDVEVSDDVWALMDPFGAFPREAASLELDVSMSGDLVTKALDQGLAGEAITEFSGQSGALDIRNFELSFGDLSLSANGNLSATAAETPEEMGLPTGTLNLMLVGANGFLDSLSSGGPIPPAQIAAARGMLGFFGRPGSEPDTLISVIELTETGIRANGIPLPFSP